MKKKDHSLFFAESIHDGIVHFSHDELRHALSVLRIDPQTALRCTDGKGRVVDCVQTAATFATGDAAIVTQQQVLRPAPFTELFIGLPERDAFEEALPQLAALGAARIIPVVCQYSQSNWWNKWEAYAERFQRLLIAGIKQALCPWLPELRSPLKFIQAVEAAYAIDSCNRFVADFGGAALPQAVASMSGCGQAACFIGPPGGFSPDELGLARSKEFVFVNIGPYRLRTQLAAVVMCAAVMQTR